MRHTRGFIASWMRLIAPPLPAASRASYAAHLILPVLSRLSSRPALPTASSAAAVPHAIRMSALLLALPFALPLVLSSDLLFVFAIALLPRHPSAIGAHGLISSPRCPPERFHVL